jgi:hypothetical protein
LLGRHTKIRGSNNGSDRAAQRSTAIGCLNPRCGRANRQDARYCARCGTKLRN